MENVFSDLSAMELRQLESSLKERGMRAEALVQRKKFPLGASRKGLLELHLVVRLLGRNRSRVFLES
jgi:hypothetical protein